MTDSVQATAFAARDVSLLAYLWRMAETACTDTARHVFDRYAEIERRRIERTPRRRGNPQVPASAKSVQSAKKVQARKNATKVFTFDASTGAPSVSPISKEPKPLMSVRRR